MIGIYKITSPSGKVYIGQSWDLESRFNTYILSKSARHSPKLDNSFKKYGIENHYFEVIVELDLCECQKHLDELEIYHIKNIKDSGIEMLNIREGGSRGKHSEESKLKMSISLTGLRKGIPLSKDWINNRTKSQTGLKRTDESKKKYSKSKIGDKNPSYCKTPTWAKLTDDQVIQIRNRKDLKHGDVSKMANEFGVKISVISSVLHNRNYKHIKS